MIQYKILQITETLLMIFTASFCVYLVIFLFPAPYFFISDTSGAAAYDSEPDYFANIISFMMNGHSMDFLHPGIPIHSVSGTILSFFNTKFSTEEIILISRAILLFLNFLFIYIGSRIILQQSILHTISLIIIFFLYPAGFVLIDNISPNSILFGLSVLIISIGSKLNEQNNSLFLIYGFFLGLAIALKYIAIILAFPALLSLFLSKNQFLNYRYRYLKKILQIVVISILSLLFFVWPIAPYLPFVITHHGFDTAHILSFFNNPIYVFFIALGLLVILILLKICFKKYFQVSFSTLYSLISFLMVLVCAAYFFKNIYTEDSFLSFAFNQRNFLVLLGSFVLFVPNVVKLKFSIKNLSFLLIILMVCFGAKAWFNNQLYLKANQEESLFTEFIKNFEQSDFLVFYPPFSFASKDLFLAWTDYRYGDQQSTFHSQDSPFVMSESSKRFRILNSKKFNLIDPTNKISFKYFEFVSLSKYFTSSQKGVALNQMSLLIPKKLCLELFDGFLPKASFTIIIPNDLSSYISKSSTETESGKNYIQSLASKLHTECNFDIKLSESYLGKQKMHILKVL